MRFVLTIILLCAALPAFAGIPCEMITTWLEGETAVALITPAGTVASLAEQGAVIHVELMDCTPAPIANFPLQDIWVSGVGDVNICPGGSVADANTDEFGRTTISGPIFGGNHSESGVMVWVSGIPSDTGPLTLDFVSPDLNGDLVVNLNDFSAFGVDFGSAAFRSDFNHDGTVNLNDFSTFGQHFGDTCP